MALVLALPEHYGWVLLAGVSTGWLTLWQSHLVGRHRRAAGISYPQAYAEKAEVKASKEALKFNCAQRAHQNTLETLPITLFFLLFSGLTYPTVAAILGALWVLGRVVYTIGYVTGDPAKRTYGFFNFIGPLGLLFIASWSVVKLLCDTL
ncbi:membrane-associated proteins in eicosanoid and glutathione metabolism [Ramaria rubella]|nr:membrane-associated proteins in eicosanoid and glutathione metabolism [Ramaria rubella]